MKDAERFQIEKDSALKELDRQNQQIANYNEEVSRVELDDPESD